MLAYGTSCKSSGRRWQPAEKSIDMFDVAMIILEAGCDGSVDDFSVYVVVVMHQDVSETCAQCYALGEIPVETPMSVIIRNVSRYVSRVV